MMRASGAIRSLAIVMLTACGAAGDDRESGLHLTSMSPEDGLHGRYVHGDTELVFAAQVQGDLHVEVGTSDGQVLAQLDSDFVAEPVTRLGGTIVGGAPLTAKDAAQLAELLESPAGAAFGALCDELPWHVDGMHHEFLAIQTLYASLRGAAGAEPIDDGFSPAANAARVELLFAGGDAPGSVRQEATSYLALPDAYICPGRADKCAGSCGTGCQGVFGMGTIYTCECLRHDLQPNTADDLTLQSAYESLIDPGRHKARADMTQDSCAPEFAPQSPSYYCSLYGASESNSVTEQHDGQTWCRSAYGGETLLSPGPQILQTDYVDHWNYGAWVKDTAGTIHHFDQPGRMTIGISGKASGVVVIRIDPGSALCNQFGGTCEPNELNQVKEEHIWNALQQNPWGCTFDFHWDNYFISTGTTTSDGSTCPEVPFFHKFASHGFGWYAVTNIPPGDYLVAMVSKVSLLNLYKGHATASVAAYQGIGGWLPVKTGACPAENGNGICESGEAGWNAPQDCCDYYTPCDQTYENQGQLWCRNVNNQGYRWMSTARYYCDEWDELGTTARCGGQTYTCSGLPDQWSYCAPSCQPGSCGWQPDGCGSWIWCGQCPPCGNSDGDCYDDCSGDYLCVCGDGECNPSAEDTWSCPQDCGSGGCGGGCDGGYVWSGDCVCHACWEWYQYCYGNGFADPQCGEAAGWCGF